MHARARPRPTWQELPAALRSRVETVLGGRVAEAESRPGGWSPGSADRLLLEDGRRAFVKTASAETNAFTVRLHRREAEVLHVLDGTDVAPRLLGTVDEPPWFALAVDDIDGRHPDPVSADDTTAVLDALARLPVAGPALGAIEDELGQEATAWTRLADDGLDTLPEAAARHVADLDRLARGAPEHLGGDRVVHGDLRVDNVLIDRSGRARIVDWPWAGRGDRCFDGVTYLLDVRAQSADPAAHLAYPLFEATPPDGVDALLALLAGYFFDAARRPPSPGIEAVRAFQRFQGEVALDWLAGRGVLPA